MTHTDATTGRSRGPDGELTFAALPLPARGRAFAATWWGTRWLKALEETALDGEQLRQGRRFARQGAVGAVSVRPGRITAVVRGRDGTPHRADVLLRELGDAEWDRLLEVTARESGHLAALLDGDMPPHLVEDAESAGVELLPGIGDLDPSCGCEAWDHCPHTAALCYQTARLLDQDPFVLLLLRGRTERQLLDELALVLRDPARAAEDEAASDEGAAESARADEQTGVPADEAFALGAILPPLPVPPRTVPDRTAAPSLTGGTPPASGLDAAALEFVVSDTVSRARQLLREAVSPDHAVTAPAHPLTRRQDAVRLAAAGPGARIEERLAAGCALTLTRFRSAVRAWELGGITGLSVWEQEEEPAAPDPEAMARARGQLAAARAEEESLPVLHETDNGWSTADGTAQLRLGPDGRWWPYRERNGTWWPEGGSEQDPAAALAVALGRSEPGRAEQK